MNEMYAKWSLTIKITKRCVILDKILAKIYKKKISDDLSLIAEELDLKCFYPHLPYCSCIFTNELNHVPFKQALKRGNMHI